MKTAYNVDINKFVIKPTYSGMYEPLSPIEKDDLTDSILTTGILVPIIVADNGDGTYTILSGHNRYEIAKQNGWKEIPIVQIAENPEEKATALMDNALRRQITEDTRRAAIARQHELREQFITASLLPDIAEMYRDGKLGEHLAIILSKVSLESQKRMIEDDAMGRLTPHEAPDITTDHRKLEIQEARSKLDEALLKVEEAAQEKKSLEAAVEKERELLRTKQRELDTLNGQLSKIRSNMAKQLASLRSETEETVRAEIESELHRSTADTQRLSKELEQAKRKVESAQEEKGKAEVRLENVGKEYKVYVAILDDLKDRYSRFVAEHRKPEVWITRLEAMKLEAQTIEKTMNIAQWPKDAVAVMESHTTAAILALKSAMDGANKNAVDFRGEFDNQAVYAGEQAKILMGRKRGRKNGKKDKEIEDREGEDEETTETEQE